MCDFTTGDDFPDIITDNLNNIAYYSVEFEHSESKIIQLESSPLKKKRGPYKRKVKASWICPNCRNTFCDKQSLQEHMENIRICVKKQKRLSEEEITLAPHEDLGSTLQSCVETLRQHQRLNEPLKAK